MIEKTIQHLLADAAAAPTRLNRLADHYRSGERSPEELLAGLMSKNVDILAAMLWIFSEIPFEYYSDNHLILERLWTLLSHASARVRIGALGALFPAFETEPVRASLVLDDLRKDPDPGVRMTAVAASSQLPLPSG